MPWVIISFWFLPSQTSHILPPSSLSIADLTSYFIEKLELIRTFITPALKTPADLHLYPHALPPLLPQWIRHLCSSVASTRPLVQWVLTSLTYLRTLFQQSFPSVSWITSFSLSLQGHFHPGIIILSCHPSLEKLPWPHTYLQLLPLLNFALQQSSSQGCLCSLSPVPLLPFFPLPSRWYILNWSCQGHHDLHVAKSSGQFLVPMSFKHRLAQVPALPS